MLQEMGESWWLRQKIKITITLILLFIISGVKSCNQVKYAAFGVETQATVTGKGIYGVQYQFNDRKGVERKGTYLPGKDDEPLPPGTLIDVKYVSFNPSDNTPGGRGNMLFPISLS